MHLYILLFWNGILDSQQDILLINCHGVIVQYNNWINKVYSYIVIAATLYFVSVMDNETVGCLLLCQEIALEPKLITYPVVDLRVSQSSTYSASQYPCSSPALSFL